MTSQLTSSECSECIRVTLECAFPNFRSNALSVLELVKRVGGHIHVAHASSVYALRATLIYPGLPIKINGITYVTTYA